MTPLEWERCPLCFTGLIETPEGICEKCAAKLEEDRQWERAWSLRKEVR